MSGEKPTNPCSKFQANVFNKSKCQNCFKSREVHLFSDHSAEQVKPIYSGWLCLAPEGTDFDNRLQKSRKWQRRYFILDEQGSLSYALDKLPSTLPQGTVNMNLCTDISDAEGRTGQKNALCIATPTKEIFIRNDHKEIMNGWSEHLAVYLRTNKQNQKKKRKVENVASQEPSPAKMAATDPSLPSLEEDADSAQRQEDPSPGGPDVTSVWTGTKTDPPCPEWSRAGDTSSYLVRVSRDSLTSDGAGRLANCVSSGSSQDMAAASINGQLAESNIIQTSANDQNKSQDSVDISAGWLLGVETPRKELRGGAAVSRKGRTEDRVSYREKLQSCGDAVQLGALPPQRRAKSLDRRTSDTVMTPDLLNFKKGWMIKLDENDQWKKYWFVLSADSLRYYKDGIAEETSDLDGEIDLAKCYNVSNYDVPRNYGFQIHTPEGVFTLSAMTAGIRKNWIQALMKNVRPVSAPDVASLPGHHVSCSPPEVLPRPDVTQDSASSDVATETDPHLHTSVMERRKKGRYKTIDWSEFGPRSKSTADAEPRESKPLCSLEPSDQDGQRRREERRRKYENMLGISLISGDKGEDMTDSRVRALSLKPQQKAEETMEEIWRQVEKAAFRAEKMLPLFTESRNSEEVEELLQSYRQQVEDLKVQLAESERHRVKLEAQLSADGLCQQQLDAPLCSEADFCSVDVIEKDSYEMTSECRWTQLRLQASSSAPPPASIWMHDAPSPLQQLEDFPPETEAALLPPPASDGRHDLCQTDGTASHHWNQPFPTAETRNNGDFAVLKAAWRDDDAPDQTVLKRLSDEVELLSDQNEALNQRNQEMLNQLTEADREIERLKAELSRRYAQEDLGKMRLEDLQKELSSRTEELQQAQTLISSLTGSLSEAEAELQLNSLAETQAINHDQNKATAGIAEGYLLRCFETTEATLMELERQLRQSELTCRELQHQNEELKEAGECYSGRAAEQLEKEPLGEGEGNWSVSGEEKIQKVIEGMLQRLGALEKLLDIISGSSFIEETEEEELKEDLSEMNPAEVALREMMERIKLEKQMLLAGHDLLLHTDEARDGAAGMQDSDCMWDGVEAAETEAMSENSQLGRDEQQVERLKAGTQAKMSLLKQISISASTLHQLQPTADTLHDFHLSDPRSASLVFSAATETLCRRHASRTRCTRQTELCQSCSGLAEQNTELKARLSNLEEKRAKSPAATTNTSCQTDESFHQSAGGNPADVAEDKHNGMERPRLSLQRMESDEEDPDVVAEQLLELRGKVKELEEQVDELSVQAERMNQEFHLQRNSEKEQHEKEMERLKATYECGLVSMKECHLKEMEEHQHLHQEELEHLLVERDRLLEEETVATVTAIEAIRRTHQEELQREVQRRRQPESSHGNTQLEDIYRQHREELESSQRELHVLSQQFALKCLENRHLVQALDAERKALCQCQLENQDLRTSNQELSGHLAAEITRLCSLPLSQKADVYEMEITLRVKESEVQSLKQKIKSLKDELQSALKDKRDAAKEYKDVFAELRMFRAKAEQEADELRENLRLAHQALVQTSP